MLVPPPNGITTASASSAALQDLDDRVLVSRAARRRPARRPRSPRRWRTRSRRLLPRAWTTRSSGSSETYSSPTARSSAARRSSLSCGSGTSSSSNASGRAEVLSTSIPRCFPRNGLKPGLSSWEKETPSSPHPHHFIAAVLAGSCRHCSHGLDLTQGAPGVGLEPTTYRLTADRSAIELPRTDLPRIIGGRARLPPVPPRPPRGNFRTVARTSGPPARTGSRAPVRPPRPIRSASAVGIHVVELQRAGVGVVATQRTPAARLRDEDLLEPPTPGSPPVRWCSSGQR